jgi:hypothetical protein
MKKLLNYPQLSFLPALIFLLISSGSLFAQVVEEEYVIDECGKPNRCVTTSMAKGKMPIPCNCIPKTNNLLNIKISVKSANSELIGAKIVTADGKVYASTDRASGGKVIYDARTGSATLQFGVVDKTLLKSKLKVVFTTFEGSGNLKNEFSVAVGD